MHIPARTLKELAPFKQPDGTYGAKIKDNNMSPIFETGETIFFSPERKVLHEDFVVAKVKKTGRIVIRMYLEKDDYHMLFSINPKFTNEAWKGADLKSYVDWIFPILTCMKNPDWELKYS